MPKIVDGLEQNDAQDDALLIVGCIISEEDRDTLYDHEVEEIFGPGPLTYEAIVFVREITPDC